MLSFVNSTVLGMCYMYLDMIPHILLLFFQSFLGVGFRVEGFSEGGLRAESFWEVGFWVEGFLGVGFWVEGFSASIN